MKAMEQNWCFLVNIGLSHLIKKLPLISNKSLLDTWAKMVKSSNKRSWLQNRRYSHIELSADGFTFLKVDGEIPMCSVSNAYKFHRNRKHCIFHTEIYTQHKAQDRKVNNL